MIQALKIALLLFVTTVCTSTASSVLADDNLFRINEAKLNKVDTDKQKNTSTEYIFNGEDSFIETTANFDSTFTFCAWIKPSELRKKNMALVGIPRVFWLRTTANRELQFTQPSINDNDTEGLLLSSNNWIFVALVIEYPSAKIFVGSEQIASFKFKREKKDWTGKLLIGKDTWKEDYHGSMQHIFVSNKALNHSEIMKQSQKLPYQQHLTNGLVFYHSFDNQHRYFFPEKTKKPLTQNITFLRDSIKGRIAHFNGENSSLNFGAIPVDNAVTISAWVRQNHFDRNYGAVAALGYAYAFRITTGGAMLFTIPQRADLVPQQARLSRGKWHHIAVTFKETIGATFFLDGKQVGTFPTEAFQDVDKELMIGANLWNDFFKGDLDDLIIWNRVLTANEIKEVAQKPAKFWDANLKIHRSKTLLYLGFVAYVLLMIFVYVRHWRRKKQAQKEQRENPFLKSINETVFQQLANSTFSVEEFAEAMNMSKTKLYNEVKQSTGKSPKEYIRDVRIQEAARLLKETQLPVTEIIYSTGFESRAFFNKCFKQKFEQTPSEYRKQEA